MTYAVYEQAWSRACGGQWKGLLCGLLSSHRPQSCCSVLLSEPFTRTRGWMAQREQCRGPPTLPALVLLIHILMWHSGVFLVSSGSAVTTCVHFVIAWFTTSHLRTEAMWGQGACLPFRPAFASLVWSLPSFFKVFFFLFFFFYESTVDLLYCVNCCCIV